MIYSLLGFVDDYNRAFLSSFSQNGSRWEVVSFYHSNIGKGYPVYTG